jgi:solute carrier family 39 (zinc transporter), member 7
MRVLQIGTFMGIGIHNLSASSGADDAAQDLGAAVRQVARGILGTTVGLGDMVRAVASRSYPALRS